MKKDTLQNFLNECSSIGIQYNKNNRIQNKFDIDWSRGRDRPVFKIFQKLIKHFCPTLTMEQYWKLEQACLDLSVKTTKGYYDDVDVELIQTCCLETFYKYIRTNFKKSEEEEV